MKVCRRIEEPKYILIDINCSTCASKDEKKYQENLKLVQLEAVTYK